MSYLVLARKWRPQTFSEVVGQDHVTVTLRKAVEKGRLAHAYLFAGPRGCGKTTTARLLAKVINCERPQGAEPCNACPSCIAVNEGKHLDVIEIDGASNRGIDEIRDLREKIGYAASQGRSKIYIIDEVHMLTTQAFNALLKTLEEPPPHVYLVFATTEPHKVPPTILSRCQRFNFKKLELSEIMGQLERICRDERLDCDGEALLLISRRAEGSMRDAESLLDQCISASAGRVDLALVRAALGLVDAHVVIDLLGAVATRDTRAALDIVDRAVSSGLDLEEFYLAYIEGLRHLLVLSIDGGTTPEWLGLTEEETRSMRRLGEHFRTADLLFLFRSAVRSFREFKGANQPRYLLEAAIAEAAAWDSAVELSEILRQLDRFGESGGPGGSKGGPGGGRVGSGDSDRPGRRTSGAHRTSGADVAQNRDYRDSRATDSRVAPEAGGRGERPQLGRDGGGPLGERSFASRSDATAAAICVPPGEGVGREAFIATPCDPESVGRPAQRRESPKDPLSPLGGREMWERFISQVREAKLTLGIWLLSAEVRGIEGDRLFLSFSPQNRFASEMITEEKNRRYIESHLERFFGKKLAIATGEMAAQGGGPGPGGGAAARSGEAAMGEERSQTPGRKAVHALDPAVERFIEGQPVIKQLIEDFEGEIVPKERFERRSKR